MTVRDSTPRIHVKMQDSKTIEGGYYKPDVDENGILRWTPSKEQMPKLPESNIKGKPGYTPIKGVDYFDGAPGKDGTDANVTTENITRALGYTPADEGDVNQLKDDLAAKLPKSPANWGPWTAEEQAVACERIGAEHLNEWEEIVTVTTEEAVSSITVDTDANGNPFSLTNVICEFILPIEDTEKTRHMYFGSDSEIGPSNVFSRVPVLSNTTTKTEAVSYAKIISGKIYCDGAIGTTIPNKYQRTQKYGIVNGYCMLSAESFNRIFVITYNDAFPIGSQLIIRGIRK